MWLSGVTTLVYKRPCIATFHTKTVLYLFHLLSQYLIGTRDNNTDASVAQHQEQAGHVSAYSAFVKRLHRTTLLAYLANILRFGS